MSETKQAAKSFFDLLAILFIALKLTGVIDWSWWWVLSPILIPIGIFLIAAIGVVVAALVAKDC